MSVRLTVHDVRPGTQNMVITSACYQNLLEGVSTAQWGRMNNVQRQLTVNQLLAPYNGALCAFEFQHIVVEFLSEDDLTHFVLTWS